MKRLFLDDLRNPKDCLTYIENPVYNENWEIVRTFNEFKEWILNNGLPDLVSFDHDLADYDSLGNEFTGKDCANFLVDYCLDNNCILPNFLIHSANPSGVINIGSLLSNFKKYQNEN